jgi:hypothetical protein
MKKFLIAACMLASSSSFAATHISLVSYFPPGGAVGKMADQIKASMDSSKYDVEVIYTKSCEQALQLTNNGTPNVFAFVASSDIRPGNKDAACNLDAVPEIKPVTSFDKSPYYFCNAVGNHISVADLKSKPVTVGVSRDLIDDAEYLLKGFPNAKIVPYRGGGLVVKAVAAKDVDLWIGGSTPIRAFPTVSCIGSTSTTDPRGMPFLGKIFGTNIEELFLSFIVYANPQTVGASLEALRGVAKNQQFRDFLVNEKITPVTDSMDAHMSKINKMHQLITK